MSSSPRGAGSGATRGDAAGSGRLSSAPAWLALDELKEVRRLNRQVVEHLAVVAREDIDNTAPALRVLRQHSHRIDTDVIETIAQVPVLLLDFRFGDAAWWSVAQELTESSKPHVAGNAVPLPGAPEWAREVLMLAVPLVRRSVLAARLHLGMSEQVAQEVRELNSRDINRLAEQHAHSLTFRCSRAPAVWLHLVCESLASPRSSLHHGRCLSVRCLGGGLPETA